MQLSGMVTAVFCGFTSFLFQRYLLHETTGTNVCNGLCSVEMRVLEYLFEHYWVMQVFMFIETRRRFLVQKLASLL